MISSKNSTHSTAGFTLVQVSILLTAAALVLVALLPSSQSTLTSAAQSTATMTTIFNALRQYQVTHGVLPCPADPTLSQGNTNYGIATSSYNGTTNNCVGSPTPTAAYADTTNHIALGMVPVKTLGLPASMAVDAFGHDISYAVDTNATSCWPSASLPGAIKVTDNAQSSSTIAVLVSHGHTGHGAWLPLPGSSGTASRLNAGITDTDTLANAQVNSSFANLTTFGSFYRQPLTSTFDEVVMYKSPLFNINQTPTVSVVTVSTYPANGTYSNGPSGSTLTFKLTFPIPVTVTGTPYLSLTVGSTVRKVLYTGGSTTNVLTFQYTLGSTSSDNDDQAPLGMSLASPIQLNGGTITPTGGPPMFGPSCLFAFSPPDLKQVIVPCTNCVYETSNSSTIAIFSGNSANSYKFIGSFASPLGMSLSVPYISVHQTSGVVDQIWLTDGSNQNLTEFDGSGNYVLTLSGGLVAPRGNALDSSNNMWLADYANNAVYKYTYSAGSYSGPTAVTGTTFNEPMGVAVDTIASPNMVWVADCKNNVVKKFNASTGVYISSTTGGGLSCPTGVAIDSSENLWVIDSGHKLIKEYPISASYVYQSVSFGSANLHTTENELAIDPAGNFWTGDPVANAIVKFNSSGSYVTSLSGSNVNTPQGVAAGR